MNNIHSWIIYTVILRGTTNWLIPSRPVCLMGFCAYEWMMRKFRTDIWKGSGEEQYKNAGCSSRQPAPPSVRRVMHGGKPAGNLNYSWQNNTKKKEHSNALAAKTSSEKHKMWGHPPLRRQSSRYIRGWEAQVCTWKFCEMLAALRPPIALQIFRYWPIL